MRKVDREEYFNPQLKLKKVIEKGVNQLWLGKIRIINNFLLIKINLLIEIRLSIPKDPQLSNALKWAFKSDRHVFDISNINFEKEKTLCFTAKNDHDRSVDFTFYIAERSWRKPTIYWDVDRYITTITRLVICLQYLARYIARSKSLLVKTWWYHGDGDITSQTWQCWWYHGDKTTQTQQTQD